MKFLLLFESFLESGYSPLYRYSPYFFSHDMLNDRIIARIPCNEEVYARKNKNYVPKKCVCLTRNINYTCQNSKRVRIKLDQNKLRENGYVPKSVDEFRNPLRKLGKIGMEMGLKKIPDENKERYYSRYDMEFEYEERIYSDIDKLGKYILSIQFSNTDKSSSNINQTKETFSNFKKYLDKYPHIKVEEYDMKNRWKIKKLNIDELELEIYK